MQAQVVRGLHGMVVSGHHLASFEAARMLRRGGNAMDAAITAAAVLCVVLPQACGLGGDAFLLVYDASAKSLHALNASGRAPAAALPAQYQNGIPRQGLRAATVPGMVGGWEVALTRFGTRSLADVLAPAISYAEAGYPVHDKLGRIFAQMAEALAKDEGARHVFLAGGRPPQTGDILRQPDLAASLSAIARDGADAFYHGDIAQRIVTYSRQHGGLFAREDFIHHESLWQQPLSAPFYGCRVATMPPNSYGLTLLLQLVELEAGNLANCGVDSAEFLLRSMRARTNAYRAAAPVIADPAGGEQDARKLLDEALREAPKTAAKATGNASEAESGSETSNVLVMDRQGNAVSLIQSIFHFFGSCVAPSGTGVVLNNRMLGFRLEEAHPNALAPRKRPAHTLSPTMVLKDDRPLMVCGTPGGPGQTATLAQVVSRLLGFGQSLGEAISAPRWAPLPDGSFAVEDSVEVAVLETLRERHAGLKIVPAAGQPFGSAKAVMLDGDVLVGVADARRNASAYGW